MKKLFAIAAALAAAGTVQAAVVPAVTKLDFVPAKTLTVGNSFTYYNCGLNLWLNGLTRVKVNPKISGRIATIGTSNPAQFPVAEYVDNSLEDSHDAAKYGKPDEKILAEEIKKRFTYDLVMIQASRTPKDQVRDAHYFKAHAAAIRKAGATPAIIYPWLGQGKDLKGYEQIQDDITRIGNDNKMMVIPVGIAWRKVLSEHPELQMYMPDKRHPTAIGSYLYAATIYASIYNRDPMEAVSFEGGCEKPIKDEAVRKILCKAAWETTQAWFGRK